MDQKEMFMNVYRKRYQTQTIKKNNFTQEMFSLWRIFIFLVIRIDSDLYNASLLDWTGETNPKVMFVGECIWNMTDIIMICITAVT